MILRFWRLIHWSGRLSRIAGHDPPTAGFWASIREPAPTRRTGLPAIGRRVTTPKSARKEAGAGVDLTLGARHALGPRTGSDLNTQRGSWPYGGGAASELSRHAAGGSARLGRISFWPRPRVLHNTLARPEALVGSVVTYPLGLLHGQSTRAGPDGSGRGMRSGVEWVGDA